MSDPKNEEQYNAEKAKAAEPLPMNDKPDYEYDVYEREREDSDYSFQRFCDYLGNNRYGS
jgi:hypothetical protein